jgi:hypothetical protein
VRARHEVPKPREAASMTRYRDAIAAGRRIKYVIAEIEMEDDE